VGSVGRSVGRAEACLGRERACSLACLALLWGVCIESVSVSVAGWLFVRSIDRLFFLVVVVVDVIYVAC
jgi:hypothetical protein